MIPILGAEALDGFNTEALRSASSIKSGCCKKRRLELVYIGGQTIVVLCGRCKHPVFGIRVAEGGVVGQLSMRKEDLDVGGEAQEK